MELIVTITTPPATNSNASHTIQVTDATGTCDITVIISDAPAMQLDPTLGPPFKYVMVRIKMLCVTTLSDPTFDIGNTENTYVCEMIHLLMMHLSHGNICFGDDYALSVSSYQNQ